jgi:hypothetical protein
MTREHIIFVVVLAVTNAVRIFILEPWRLRR